MILSFKRQFKQKILNGTKIHTIRLDPHNRWNPGMKIHFATGVRTKNYEQFMEGKCKSVQYIDIEWYDNKNRIFISINQRPLNQNEIAKLIKSDGFDSFEQFQKWFNSDFSGKIIHWTDFKY